MEIDFSEEKIIFQKEINNLDDIVMKFVSIINKLNIKYVIVSGYVAILFGRSRTSEDIDIIIEKIDMNKFKELWEYVCENFECLNIERFEGAYKEYLNTGHAIRFSKKTKFIPNLEVKFPKTELESLALDNRKKVILNDKYTLFISPLELQVSFKLFLGSEKDIEDARFIYRLFKNKMDLPLLKEFNRKLKIEALFNKYLI